MAEIYKGVFEDDKGNRYYAASDTEITYDTAGIPLNNGGDLSEASVNFTVSSSRKALTAKARFKALMGDIAKWLTDLGPAAFYRWPMTSQQLQKTIYLLPGKESS